MKMNSFFPLKIICHQYLKYIILHDLIKSLRFIITTIIIIYFYFPIIPIILISPIPIFPIILFIISPYLISIFFLFQVSLTFLFFLVSPSLFFLISPYPFFLTSLYLSSLFHVFPSLFSLVDLLITTNIVVLLIFVHFLSTFKLHQ